MSALHGSGPLILCAVRFCGCSGSAPLSMLRGGQFTGARSGTEGAAEPAENCSRRGSDHGLDVGSGDRRLHAVLSIKQAISYCGLCGEEKRSADKVMLMPISKQRNKHIQRVLIEAAKLWRPASLMNSP